MGFFEGTMLLPHPLTWMDKVIVECVDALCWWEKERPACENQQKDSRTSDVSLTPGLRVIKSNLIEDIKLNSAFRI